MNRLFIFLLALSSVVALAADNPVACQGASCKVVIETRDGSNVKVTAGRADGTGAWTIGPSGFSGTHTINGSLNSTQGRVFGTALGVFVSSSVSGSDRLMKFDFPSILDSGFQGNYLYFCTFNPNPGGSSVYRNVITGSVTIGGGYNTSPADYAWADTLAQHVGPGIGGGTSVTGVAYWYSSGAGEVIGSAGSSDATGRYLRLWITAVGTTGATGSESCRIQRTN